MRTRYPNPAKPQRKTCGFKDRPAYSNMKAFQDDIARAFTFYVARKVKRPPPSRRRAEA